MSDAPVDREDRPVMAATVPSVSEQQEERAMVDEKQAFMAEADALQADPATTTEQVHDLFRRIGEWWLSTEGRMIPRDTGPAFTCVRCGEQFPQQSSAERAATIAAHRCLPEAKPTGRHSDG